MFVSRFIKKLRPYKVASHKVWEVSDGSEVLKLDWNEATVPPSPAVIGAIRDFISNNHLNWYPDTNNQELIRALAEYNGIPAENVQYFASSDSLHEYVLRAFIEPDDGVTIVSPTYDNFRAVVESIGGRINYFYLDKYSVFDYRKFGDFEKSSGSKLVYLCNPNNPSGTEYDTSLIETMLKDFPGKLFILDEAYYEFTERTAKGLVSRYENIIITRTFSKAFALASFRIGYMLSCKKNIDIVNTVRNPKNISSLSQVASIAALKDIAYVRNYVREVNEAKRLFEKNLFSLAGRTLSPLKSGGGNFVLLKVNENAEGFISFLESNNIFIRNYSHVSGMEGHVRITIGTVKQMDKVFGLIKAYCDGK